MAAPRLRISCFPGFLGHPQDFEFLARHCPELSRAGQIEWRTTLADPGPGEDWGAWTQRWLRENPAIADAASGEAREILLGYSLGGRAAAHLLVAAPERFCGLVAISTNPGLKPEARDERAARREADESWARRFECEPWSVVVAAWNAQPVLGGGSDLERLAPARAESSELRARCARQLRQLSLAAQDDLSHALRQSSVRQAWLAGERDSKFVEITRRMASAENSRGFFVPSSGHRWPWELPEAEASRWVARAISSVLERSPA